MTYRDAKRLHNGDEITIKETGEVVKVIKAKVLENIRAVEFEIVSNRCGFCTVLHIEVL